MRDFANTVISTAAADWWDQHLHGIIVAIAVAVCLFGGALLVLSSDFTSPGESNSLICESAVIEVIDSEGVATIRNSGSKVARIVGAGVSCSCITPLDEYPIVLQPDEELHLRFAVDVDGGEAAGANVGTVFLYVPPITDPIDLTVRMGSRMGCDVEVSPQEEKHVNTPGQSDE